MVFRVLREIAMGARFGDLANDRRSLLRLELAQLVVQTLKSGACHRELLHVTPSFGSRTQPSMGSRPSIRVAAGPRLAATEVFRTNRESRTGAAQLQAPPPSRRRWRAPRPGRRPSSCSAERRA